MRPLKSPHVLGPWIYRDVVSRPGIYRVQKRHKNSTITKSIGNRIVTAARWVSKRKSTAARVRDARGILRTSESNFDALHRSSLKVCSRHYTFKHCGTIPSKIACRLQLKCCYRLPTLLRLLRRRGFQVLSCLFAANPRLQRTPLLFPRSYLGAAQTFVLSQNFSSPARLGKPQRKSNIRAAWERDKSIAPPFSVSTPRSIPSFVAPHAQLPHHPLQNQLAALPSSAARPSSELRVRIVLSPSNPVSSVQCASLDSSRVLSFPETMNTYVPGHKTTLGSRPYSLRCRLTHVPQGVCTAHGGRRQAETSPYPGELRPHSVKDM